MMKIIALLACLVTLSNADELTLENCKCWSQYNAVKNADNKIECEGIMLAHTMDCNEPEPPHCDCTTGVTGILSDKTGTWCTTYKDGTELKRWACENKDEWESYKIERDAYDKSIV